MKKNISREIKIPEGVQVELNGKEIVVKAEGKELKRKFDIPNVEISVDSGIVKLNAEKATKREGKLMGTSAAHIKNMLDGIKENYVYKLEVCSVHFPMNVKAEEGKVVIKSFLGEKQDRISRIPKNVKVDVKGNQIEVSSYDKEAAGQTAANLEKATRLKGRDRRIFQDGIYITEKPGRAI